MAMCLLVGLVVTVGVAQVLGLLVNYHSPQIHWTAGADAPEVPPDPQRFTSVSAHSSNGFGTRRRGWYFYDLILDSHRLPPLPRPDYNPGRWWNLPRAWGPIVAWTPGGDAAWGGLFRTDHLVTESDWRGFRGIDDARGFPALCLWHEIRREGDVYTTPGGVLLSDPRVSAGSELTVRAFAYRPIWGGLAVNTAFWGGLVWVIGWMVALRRRSGRIMRGLCIACRYDLGRDYSRGCPECGWGRA